MLRSLGEFFGLAGARVGFVLAEPMWLQRLRDHLGSWTLAGPSCWVAARALADRRWQEGRTRPTRAPERAARRVAGGIMTNLLDEEFRFQDDSFVVGDWRLTRTTLSQETFEVTPVLSRTA